MESLIELVSKVFVSVAIALLILSILVKDRSVWSFKLMIAGTVVITAFIIAFTS